MSLALAIVISTCIASTAFVAVHLIGWFVAHPYHVRLRNEDPFFPWTSVRNKEPRP